TPPQQPRTSTATPGAITLSHLLNDLIQSLILATSPLLPPPSPLFGAPTSPLPLFPPTALMAFGRALFSNSFYRFVMRE
ncbi:hypothetical protein NL480_29835, partial [Klebsiella pneumoniae]|nr:hypothetical protein [Klebsiella pneumoniae]